MECIGIFFQTVWELLIAIIKVLLSFIPVYKTFSDIDQTIIANILGVSPIVVMVMLLVVEVIKIIH